MCVFCLSSIITTTTILLLWRRCSSNVAGVSHSYTCAQSKEGHLAVACIMYTLQGMSCVRIYINNMHVIWSHAATFCLLIKPLLLLLLSSTCSLLFSLTFSKFSSAAWTCALPFIKTIVFNFCARLLLQPLLLFLLLRFGLVSFLSESILGLRRSSR